ncbi:hypothetical protein SDC9_197507 [bioreactor metagenome]|uniref:Uncharacterized protein n=1 Tax=bioreactor metagenome TaxID=1076179 RepID=A0A645IRI0_9ZZZZ
MQGHFTGGPFFKVLYSDLIACRHKRDLMQGLFMLLAIRIGMYGFFVVAKGHARTDDVQHCDTVMSQGCLDEFLHLARITGKGPGHKTGVGHQRFHGNIHR